MIRRQILVQAVAPSVAGPRFRLPAYVLALVAGAAMLASPAAQAGTPDNVINGQADLTLGTTYSAGLPGTTSDVVFTNVAYAPPAFTLNTNGFNLSIGTLNDLSTTALTIQNTTAGSVSTITLNGGTDSTAGTAAGDLLYVATGGNLSLGGSTGTLNLTLAVAGNFNIAGTGVANISSAITATGLALSKTGTGTLNLLGAGASSVGALNQNNGTINFGSASDAPTLTATGGVTVNTGNFNLVNGSLTPAGGLTLAGANVYTQTGGTFSTTGRISLANNGTGVTSTVNVSAGTFSTTASSGIETVRGNSIINLSGTGAITAPIIDLTTAQLSGGAASGIFNLNGGTLTTGQIIAGANGTTGTGTVFNFNGGLLTSSANSATFMQGLTSANVLAGGAVINTAAFNDTINQNLLTSTTSTGGGLTKSGTGTLVLGGTNTYTGANVIAAGTLGVTSDSSLGAVPAAAANNIQFTGTTGTLQDTMNNVTLSANRSITIANGATATLDSQANVFVVGSAITLNNSVTSTAVTTLSLAGTGTTTSTFSGTLSDSGSTGGLILNKAGAGTWTFGGSGTSTLAKGNVVVAGGNFNFGVAGGASPTLITTGTTVTNGGTGFNVTGAGSVVNVANGTLTVANGVYGILFGGGGGQTFNQTGGAVSSNGLIGFSDSGGTTTVNVSGGSLTSTRGSFGGQDGITLATRGVTTFNLSGTGIVTAPTLNLTTSQIAAGVNSTGGGTFNLGNGTVGGGTLVVNQIIPGTGSKATTFNFNGGTLQASAASTTFLTGITAANVQAGGAVINFASFNITIAQPLLTGTAAGTPDGGLTKNGTGMLTLSGVNTYTGATTLNAGGLILNTATALSDTALLTIANGTTFNLNAGAGTSETVGSLILGGTAEAPGTYTAAQLMGFDPAITFTNSGETLTVLNAVPEPSTWVAGLLCLGAMGLKLRRRLSGLRGLAGFRA